jgi:hypothetical protein
MKKYFLYTVLVIFMIMFFSLDARRFEHRRHRSGPRVSVSYGVSYPICATYPYRDHWMRYRPYRYYGPYYYDYPYYSVVYDTSAPSYNDDQEYYEEKRKKQVEQVYVNERTYQGVPFICIELPSVDRSLYEINGRSYSSLYALFAAFHLRRYEVTSATRTVAQLKESKERFYREAESLGVMHTGYFRDFTKKAFTLIKKGRQQKTSSKKMRDSITFCTEDDLKEVVNVLGVRIIVGYDSGLGDVESMSQLIEAQVVRLKEKESKIFCLPCARNSKEWAAIKLEKKGGMVYGVMMKVY